MLSFVLEHKPREWESTNDYSNSFVLFELSAYNEEYQQIKNYFLLTQLTIKNIKRVQNPFQYGRFKLRQEMLGNYSVVRKILFMLTLKN